MHYYELVENMTYYSDFYGRDVGGHGTLAKGSIFELVREPIPRKKMYKLKPVKLLYTNKFDKWNDGSYLYLRKRSFTKYFKKMEEPDYDGRADM